MKKTPEIQKAKHVMVTENTTLHLADESSSSFKYYIYAYGEVTASFTTPAKAIQKADEQMGVVMDNRSHVVWERGGKFISKEVSGMSYPDTADSKKAAVLMLLQAAQSETDESSLKGSSIMSMLKTHIKQPADLTGCTLDEVLYFVSSGKPVIGMLSDSHAVVITGYTTSTVTWLDPVTHKKNTTSLTSAEHTFKDAGIDLQVICKKINKKSRFEIQTGFLLCFFRVSFHEYMFLIMIFVNISQKNIFLYDFKLENSYYI